MYQSTQVVPAATAAGAINHPASQMIHALTGDPNTPVLFFAAKDNDSSRVHPQPILGRLQDLLPRLEALNRQGAGIFLTVNQVKGRRRKAEDVTAIRALFVDGDTGPIPKVWGKPTKEILEHKPGFLHARNPSKWAAFWPLAEGEDPRRFRAAQLALADFYKSDKAVADLPRVMRLPGFLHQKDPTQVQTYATILCDPDTVYTIDEVLAAHGFDPTKVVPEKPTVATTPVDLDHQITDQEREALDARLQRMPGNCRHKEMFSWGCDAVQACLPREDAVASMQNWMIEHGREARPGEAEEIIDDAIKKVRKGLAYISTPGVRPELDFQDAPIAPSNLPAQIILPGDRVSITESAKIIFSTAAPRREWFFRGGRVHELISDGEARSLQPLTTTAFRSRLESLGQTLAWRAGRGNAMVLKPTPCPEDTAKALLETREARDLLPGITSVLSRPIITVDDAGAPQIVGPGYHPVLGGVFITGGAPPPTVLLPKAVEGILALLEDFDFLTPGDRSRALASIITPALRFGKLLRSSDHIPMDIGEAAESQSGKTLRQSLVAKIYGEKPSVITQRMGGVGSLDESISQRLVEGRPFIQFDNLRGSINSPTLEALLTPSGTFGARIPRHGEVQVDPRSFIFMGTSNGIQTTPDLANRASIVRIRKRPPGYQFREWPEGGLLEHVDAKQPYYLGCVVAVIRAWIEAGRPRNKVTGHDFLGWAGVLDWIVQEIFHAAPLLEGHHDARERLGDPVKGWGREVALRLAKERPGVALRATAIAAYCNENGIAIPGIKDPSQDEMGQAKQVGNLLTRVVGPTGEATLDGVHIQRLPITDSSGRPTHAYCFGAGKATDSRPF